jgi:hypothetical protein
MTMKAFSLIFLLFTITDAPVLINWGTLADVSFTTEFVEKYDANFFVPSFGPKVKALEGKEVILQGYMLPVAPEEDLFILSKTTYASCFFCGVGGPETIVEIRFKPGHPQFEMDQVVKVKGILDLNKDDIEHCNYIITEAEVFRGN